MTGEYAPGPLNAIRNIGITGTSIYSGCIDEATLDYIVSGEITAGNDETSLPGVFGYIMVQNFLDGNKLFDGGKAPFITLSSFEVNHENAETYRSVFIKSNPITAAEVQNLCGRNNGEVDYQYFVNYLNNLSLDSIAATH